jgi:hypothetical protein
MKVFPPAPGGTRNALSVEDEGKIFLSAGKQAGHSIVANLFQRPGRRLNALQCLVADLFINGLDYVLRDDELFAPARVSACAVFFTPLITVVR